jgi:hypothetical protein
MSSKLRESLNQLLGLIDNEILVFNKSLEPSDISQAQYHIDKAVEAYEEPLRNCEVGTAEEQTKRFQKFCSAHTDCYKCDCPCDNNDGGCQLRWAQTPYEEVKSET